MRICDLLSLEFDLGLNEYYAALLDWAGRENEFWIYFVLLVIAGPITHTIVSAIFYYGIERRNALNHLRFLPDRRSDHALNMKAITNDTLGNVIFAVPVYYGIFWYVDRVRNPELVVGAVPTSAATWAWQVAGMFLFADAIFYWSHYLLHSPYCYKWHKQHHEYKVPSGWAQNYAHPMEILLHHAPPALVPPLVFGCHLSVRVVFLALITVSACLAHCGYKVPGVWWFSSPTMHNFHHSHNVGSYGVCLPLWDRVMGTDAQFWEYQARLRAGGKREVCEKSSGLTMTLSPRAE